MASDSAALAQRVDELQAQVACEDDHKVQTASRLIGVEELLRTVSSRLEAFEANISGLGPRLRGLEAKIDERLESLECKVFGRLDALLAELGGAPPAGGARAAPAAAWTPNDGPIPTTDLTAITADDGVPMILAAAGAVLSVPSASPESRSPAASVCGMPPGGGAAGTWWAAEGAPDEDVPWACEGASVVTVAAPLVSPPPSLAPASVASPQGTSQTWIGGAPAGSGSATLATGTWAPVPARPAAAPRREYAVATAAAHGSGALHAQAGVWGPLPAPTMPSGALGTIVSQKTTVLSATRAAALGGTAPAAAGAASATTVLSATGAAALGGAAPAAAGAASAGEAAARPASLASTPSLRMAGQYLQAESADVARAFERACSALPPAPARQVAAATAVSVVN